MQLKKVALPYCPDKIPILRAVLGYLSIFSEPWSLLGFGLTLTYNGKRGKQCKMLNYWFYPVHLLVYAGIGYWLIPAMIK